MADVHDKMTRSRNMAAIKGKNTKPEVWLRKELFKRGFRYRLHRKDLPGKPDITLPRFRTVILVNGCFWHLHEGCKYCKLPKSNTEFWRQKLLANKDRDIRNHRLLVESGWKVIIVWECAIKGQLRRNQQELLDTISHQVLSSNTTSAILEGTSNQIE
jgi:DNA mismatch endonuclease (patch repair protein)